MLFAAHRSEAPSAIRTDLNAIFVSLELSQSKWLITSLSPGNGEKLSKFMIAARDVPGLLARLAELQRKADARTGTRFGFVVIQEAGLDGFWLHRVLEAEGFESYVVDPASIAVSRRKRRAKTDRIDDEMLLRTLLAYMRGDPRVCAMVRAPTPEEEDRRRISRERKSLTNERIRHVGRAPDMAGRPAAYCPANAKYWAAVTGPMTNVSVWTEIYLRSSSDCAGPVPNPIFL